MAELWNFSLRIFSFKSYKKHESKRTKIQHVELTFNKTHNIKVVF